MSKTRSIRTRRFIAKYIRYLELFSYLLIFIIGSLIIAAFTWEIDMIEKGSPASLVPTKIEISSEEQCKIISIEVVDSAEVFKGQALAIIDTENEKGKLLKASVDGMVLIGDNEIGDQINAGEKIITLVDFNRLYSEMNFSQKNSFLCQPGQKGEIEVIAEQDFETVISFKYDVKPNVPFVGGKADFYSQEHSKDLRKLINNNLMGSALLSQEDAKNGALPLEVTKINYISIENDIKPNDSDIMDGNYYLSESFRFRPLEVRVVSGEQNANIRILNFEDSLNKVINEFIKTNFSGNRYGNSSYNYRIDEILDKDVFVTVETSKDMGSWDWDNMPNGAPFLIPNKSSKSSKYIKRINRTFKGKLELVKPPSDLIEVVKKYYIQGNSLQVKGKLIVGKTTFAMLLFKKN